MHINSYLSQNGRAPFVASAQLTQSPLASLVSGHSFAHISSTGSKNWEVHDLQVCGVSSYGVSPAGQDATQRFVMGFQYGRTSPSAALS